MKPYYVLLTGSKNNSGDYLIKYRAKELNAPAVSLLVSMARFPFQICTLRS